MSAAHWPELPAEWADTYATLHMWTQIVGKVALAQSPPLNHSWGVALQVTPRGLTTRPLPHGARTFTDRVRLHRSPAGDRGVRFVASHDSADRAQRVRVLPRGDDDAGRDEPAGSHLADAE
jgi:hypothetical protein